MQLHRFFYSVPKKYYTYTGGIKINSWMNVNGANYITWNFTDIECISGNGIDNIWVVPELIPNPIMHILRAVLVTF